MRKVVVYLKKITDDFLFNLKTIIPNCLINQIKENTYLLELDEFDETNALSIKDNLLIDFYIDVVALNFPKKMDEQLINTISSYLSDFNPGVYHIYDIITYSVTHNKTELQKKLKTFYLSVLSSEVVETCIGFIKADLNASKAAQELYMHRNTLNYRLDNFVEITEINIRKFTQAMAVYLLLGH